MADSLLSRRILANKMSSGAGNHVDKTCETTACFQPTIRKAVAVLQETPRGPRVGCRFLRIVLVATKCLEHLPGRHAVRRRQSFAGSVFRPCDRRMVVILCAFTVRSDKQQSSIAAERSVIEFKSLVAKRDGGIEAGSAARRDIAGKQSNARQKQSDDCKRHRIGRLNSVKHAGH